MPAFLLALTNQGLSLCPNFLSIMLLVQHEKLQTVEMQQHRPENFRFLPRQQLFLHKKKPMHIQYNNDTNRKALSQEGGG